jgi:hypothetical protein
MPVAALPPFLPTSDAVALASPLLLLSLTCLRDTICAGNTFFWRRRGLRRKDDTDRYDDPYGPTILAAVLLFALAAIFTSGVVKLVTNNVLVSAVRSATTR